MDNEVKTDTPLTVSPVEHDFRQQDFYHHAVSGNTLLISVCTYDASGCHTFGASLATEFEGLDVAKIFGCMLTNFITPLKKTSYEYIFITGCGFNKSHILKDNFNIEMIKTVYVITPPHLQTRYTFDEVTRFFLEPQPYKIRIVSAGINCSLPNSIGSPSPIPRSLKNPEYQLPETCYGLSYINTTALDNPEGADFLNAYFLQVKHAAQADSASVILIDNVLKDYIEKIASTHNITIHLITRLDQNSFIECLRQLSRKRGWIASDGVQTVREVLGLEGRFLIFNPLSLLTINKNRGYYLSLLKTLPTELKDIGKVVLGQSLNYSLLTGNDESIQKIFMHLHYVESQSVEKFKRDKQASLTLSPEKLMAENGFHGARHRKKTASSCYEDSFSITVLLNRIRTAATCEREPDKKKLRR